MPGLFFYIFWLLWSAAGALALARLFMPVRGWRLHDEMHQDRRRALGLAGFGVMVMGVLAFIDTYADRHEMVDGVIFIPSGIAFWSLMLSLACIVVGLLWLIAQRPRPPKPEEGSASDEKMAMADDLGGEDESS